MSTTLAAFIVADRDASPAASFTPLGRLAAAGTLIAGATFQVVAFALIPDFDKTLDRLQWIADHQSRAEVSKTFDLLAVPFLLGGVIVLDAPLSQPLPAHVIALVGAILIASSILRAGTTQPKP